MFSTTLTVLDGFPRALSTLLHRFVEPETPIQDVAPDAPTETRDPVGVAYWGALVVLAGGAMMVITWLQGSLKSLVDLATTLSFFTAPILAWLNHRAVTGAEVPVDRRPGKGMLTASIVSIVVMTLFAAYWLKIRFIG